MAAIIALNRVVQNRGVRGVCTLRGGFCPFNVGGFLVHWMAENRTGGGLFNEKYFGCDGRRPSEGEYGAACGCVCKRRGGSGAFCGKGVAAENGGEGLCGV